MFNIISAVNITCKLVTNSKQKTIIDYYKILQFFLTPLYDEDGNVAYHIGVQVSERNQLID